MVRWSHENGYQILQKGRISASRRPHVLALGVSQVLGRFCTLTKERCAPQERERWRPAKEMVLGCGNQLGGAPRVQGKNPFPIIGTLGVVRRLWREQPPMGALQRGGREGLGWVELVREESRVQGFGLLGFWYPRGALHTCVRSFQGLKIKI